MDDVIDVTTLDGQDVRVKVIIFASGKIARDAEAAMRTQIRKDVMEKASKMNLEDFLREILFKKLASTLGPNLKKIAPLRRIEIRKLEIKENFAK
ncbi:30S ribosomal protein S3Ae [uncultured archaeon]|nr:30S ribosomal protein S3Ae [uncultured archaeon]